MIDLLRGLKSHGAYARRIFALFAALLLAEFFYKLHSFSLECLAFLATWLLIDCLVDLLTGVPARGAGGEESRG